MGDFRKNFGQVKKILEIPNLIEIQTQSYEKFLQKDIAPAKRGNFGLQGAFKSVFPFRTLAGNVLWNLSVIESVMSGTM